MLTSLLQGRNCIEVRGDRQAMLADQQEVVSGVGGDGTEEGGNDVEDVNQHLVVPEVERDGEEEVGKDIEE